MRFSLSPNELIGPLIEPQNSTGAVVSFVGRVRNLNEGRQVLSLQYEAFDELAVSEGESILGEALARFPILDARCVHRTGLLSLGEAAILVEVAAAHRQEAFRACEWIVDEVKARAPIWKKEFYTDAESQWLQPGPKTTPSESDYYARQMRLQEIGEAGQDKLKSSSVLVVGAGALGCAALPYLAAAGVGIIGICDSDSVEISNLSRQPLFTTDDVGKSKTQVAAERLRKINPFIAVTEHNFRVTRDNSAELVGAYDLILECTDSLETKFNLNEAAVAASKPLLVAGIYRYEGQLQLISPGQACLNCLWPEEPDPSCVGTCAEVGVLGAVPGVIGSLQACEALKLLLGLPSPLQAGKLILFDLTDNRITEVQAHPRSDCSVCGEHPEPRENPMELVPESMDGFRVVDIRESDELVEEPFPFDSGEWMPLSAWTGEDLDDRPTLFVCHAGVRSLRLVSYLRGQNRPKTFSLPGGVSTLRGILRTRV